MRKRAVKLLGIAAGQGAGILGAQDGPRALRALGTVKRLTSAGHEVEDLGDIPGVFESAPSSPAIAINSFPHVLQTNRQLHACVLGTLTRDPEAFLLMLGGDHSLAIGALGGLADASQRLGIVWIDAHGDFNTPGTSPSGNAHGMSLAVACGLGWLELRQIANRDPFVQPGDVALLGARDLDAGERATLERLGICVEPMSAWRAAGVAAAARRVVAELAERCDHVHLSFDIDALDAAAVPGTGTPVAGGLSTEEAHALLAELSAQDLLHSASFVEYNPHLDERERTGRLTVELIASFMATDAAATE